MSRVPSLLDDYQQAELIAAGAQDAPRGKRVKKKLHILLCTNDTKYAVLRRKLSIEGSYTPTLIVDMISIAVSANVGAAAAAVVPLVALCLFEVLQVGKSAYCS